MRLIRGIVVAVLALCSLLPLGGTAQPFPDKAVLVLMPFPPGTGPDVVMRMVGTCGSCLSTVLEGVPDHRDSFLSPSERKSNRLMAACVSKSMTGKLVLDW